MTRIAARLSARLVAPALALLAACGTPTPEPTAEPAARVDGETITMDSVDARVREADPDAWQAFYEARRQALDYLVNEELLRAEAARLGIGRDSLVSREVTGKLAGVSDSAVAAFYESNRRRMGQQSLDEVREPIRQYLAAGEHRQAWGDYLSVLGGQAEVEILLQPPRVDIEVAAGEPAKGPADAPVTIVEYSDFECPYCGRAQPALEQVLEAYGDDVRLVYRDFPLGMHAHAHQAAQAARCAHEQGRFWEYHDVLFANREALDEAGLQRHAETAGLDTEAFSECLGSGRHADAVDLDMETGQRLGVTGTPAFFINGRLLSGAQPVAAFRQIIDEELERAGR